MQVMFDMLDVEFPRKGCDHTLRLTQAWLVSNGPPVEPVILGYMRTVDMVIARRWPIPKKHGEVPSTM
jgi:hypothetical protein